MSQTDDRSAQVPYAPYRIEPCASGGQVQHPATGKRYTLNRHALNLLRLCDGWHTLAEVSAHAARASGLAEGQVGAILAPLLQRLTEDGLLWWRRERVRHFRAPPPELIYLDLTMACNLRCAHCGVSAGRPLATELSSAEWRDVLDQAAQAGIGAVCLSGGEPLLREDLFDLAAHARARGLLVELSTNGMLITPEVARRLREVVDSVQVSLDGSTAAIHEGLRGPGSFEPALQGIRNLRAAGVPFLLGCVVNKQNLGDIAGLALLASELGAASLRLIHFVPFGRGRAFPHLEPSPGELRRLVLEIGAIRRRSPVQLTEVNFEFLLASPQPLSAATLRGPLSCGGCWSSLTVTPEGEVLPCSFFTGMRADSIRERRLLDIWQNGPLFNYWRSLRVAELGGRCGACAWLETCRGGCPAANFARGQLLQPHVHCFLTAEEAARGIPLAPEPAALELQPAP